MNQIAQIQIKQKSEESQIKEKQNKIIIINEGQNQDQNQKDKNYSQSQNCDSFKIKDLTEQQRLKQKQMKKQIYQYLIKAIKQGDQQYQLFFKARQHLKTCHQRIQYVAYQYPVGDKIFQKLMTNYGSYEDYFYERKNCKLCNQYYNTQDMVYDQSQRSEWSKNINESKFYGRFKEIDLDQKKTQINLNNNSVNNYIVSQNNRNQNQNQKQIINNVNNKNIYTNFTNNYQNQKTHYSNQNQSNGNFLQQKSNHLLQKKLVSVSQQLPGYKNQIHISNRNNLTTIPITKMNPQKKLTLFDSYNRKKIQSTFQHQKQRQTKEQIIPLNNAQRKSFQRSKFCIKRKTGSIYKEKKTEAKQQYHLKLNQSQMKQKSIFKEKISPIKHSQASKRQNRDADQLYQQLIIVKKQRDQYKIQCSKIKDELQASQNKVQLFKQNAQEIQKKAKIYEIQAKLYKDRCNQLKKVNQQFEEKFFDLNKKLLDSLHPRYEVEVNELKSENEFYQGKIFDNKEIEISQLKYYYSHTIQTYKHRNKALHRLLDYERSQFQVKSTKFKNKIDEKDEEVLNLKLNSSQYVKRYVFHEDLIRNQKNQILVLEENNERDSLRYRKEIEQDSLRYKKEINELNQKITSLKQQSQRNYTIIKQLQNKIKQLHNKISKKNEQ